MKAAVTCIIGLLWVGSLSAEPFVEGHVRLPSGAPVPGAQVLLFDLADLRAPPLAATTDGAGHFTLPLASLSGALPEQFELGANYPNPFNPSTMIPYRLPEAMHVRLEVYNILGQRVALLVDGEQPGGFHTASWDATDAAGQAVGAGVYLYRLSGDGTQATRSMLLIDGQAGIASGGGGSTGLEGEAGAGTDGEAAPVYGLTVSGPGLVPYVDPAFGTEAGMGPLDLVVEAAGSVPGAKAASSGGILGDVDNTGSVDFFDALLVALYSRDASIAMPNDGDILFGDVDADGQVDLTDAWLIAVYLKDPSDPALPSGIGEPVGPAASLSPDPSTVTFADDGAWHRFTVQAGEPVSVVANPEGTTPRLEITTRSGRGNYCPAEADDDVSRRDGQVVYLSGCATGPATVELRRASDDTVLRTYAFEVTGIPADLVVESVSVSDSTLTPEQSFTLRATVRNQGTTGAEATNLLYYRSSNRTISNRDAQVGTDAVRALAAAGTSAESIGLTAPSTEGTYYYGACVESLPGERGGNNCSPGVRVIVEEADTTPITIPDANLRAVILAALGKAGGETITAAEMATLDNLHARQEGISDLTGLEFATNLTRLNLHINRVSDLSPLAGLNNLTYLGLWINRVSDVSPLSGLNNLTHLVLEANGISDVSPLSGLRNLTSLGLGANDISDVSPLSGLNNLTRLHLDGNNISDVSPLAGLTSLTWLGLSENEISDVLPLAGLTNLRELDLRNNRITDLSPLVANSGLAQGDDVDVRGNPLSAISYSTHVPALESRGVDLLADPDPETIEEYDTPTFVAEHDDRVVVMGLPGRLKTDPIDFQPLAQVFYTHYEDAFDYLIVLSNLPEYRDNEYYTYFGIHLSARNDVEGTGRSRYSRNEEVGSAGRLNAILHMPWNKALLSGPALHEILHSWANYAIPTAVGGHWGFSSANGQLGGFDRTNLVDHGGGRYSAGSFGTFANGGNSVPYSPIELYFAGLIPPSEVPDLWVAEDGTWLQDAAGNWVHDDDSGDAIFTASRVSEWSIERIVAEHGARVPDSGQSQKHFRAALVLAVDPLHPPLQSTLDDLSDAVREFTHAGEDDDRWGRFNFWEATGGRATLTMDGLSAYRRLGAAGKRTVSYRVVEPEANHDGSVGCIQMHDVPWPGQWMAAPSDHGNR